MHVHSSYAELNGCYPKSGTQPEPDGKSHTHSHTPIPPSPLRGDGGWMPLLRRKAGLKSSHSKKKVLSRPSLHNEMQ